jgi:hypothetical protein
MRSTFFSGKDTSVALPDVIGAMEIDRRNRASSHGAIANQSMLMGAIVSINRESAHRRSARGRLSVLECLVAMDSP